MSLGSVQVLNVQNKPALISLSTKYGSQCDSTLSDVTWTMQESISAADDNFTAVVNVHSMIFNNTFPNIVTGYNDKLKIASTWINTTYNASSVKVITIPQGQYTIDSLVAYLNTPGLSKEYYAPYSYGCSFSVSTDKTHVIMNSINGGTTAASDGNMGIWDVQHVYTGFYLVADSETIPLLNTMGFLEFGQDGQPSNTIRVVQGAAANPISYPVQTSGTFQGIGFAVYTGGTGTYYNFTSPWTAPGATNTTFLTASNVPELAGTSALSISWLTLLKISTISLTLCPLL